MLCMTISMYSFYHTVKSQPLDPGKPGTASRPLGPGDPGDPNSPGRPASPLGPGRPFDPPGPAAPLSPGIPFAPGKPEIRYTMLQSITKHRMEQENTLATSSRCLMERSES